MQAETFDFDSETLAGTTDQQRAFAGQVRDSIRTLRPTKLDFAAVQATLSDGALTIELPHAGDPDQDIGVTVKADEAIVYYGVEHEHFFPEDQASGKMWPIDAPDFALAALRLLEQLLLGRIELDIRPGRITQKTRSYWITETGDRDLFLRGGTVLLKRHPGEQRVVRFDFGADPRPGSA